MSSISFLFLSYLEKYEACRRFFDARFFETFIRRFHPIFPDGIYFPCIELYKQIRQIHSSCFQTLLKEKAERILFTYHMAQFTSAKNTRTVATKPSSIAYVVMEQNTKNHTELRWLWWMKRGIWGDVFMFVKPRTRDTENSYEIDNWLIETIKATLQSWFLFGFTR